ncbi:MAG: winged helix-turn-helix transcriptional regulator [Gammaproteobacteria bacterium]|nr:winged helix-turn-helix transcriptional regulator [Gammaproteobacteria bacterium]
MRKDVDIVNHSSDDDPDDVLEVMHAVMHLFRARRQRALGAAGHPLPHMEARVLGFFARHPGATPGDLVVHSGRDKGQIARLIGGLRERGLLEARADAADRRSVRLALTPQGRSVQQTLQRHSRRLSAVATAGLSAGERRQLLALLHKLRRQLEAPEPPGSPPARSRRSL